MAQNFDEAAQRELAKFLEAEQAKARLQQSIHTFCDLAFDKCVTKIGTLILLRRSTPSRLSPSAAWQYNIVVLLSPYFKASFRRNNRKRNLDKGGRAIPTENKRSCSSTHRCHNVTEETKKRSGARNIVFRTRSRFAVRNHSHWRQPPIQL